MAEMIISQERGGDGVAARLCDEQAGATLYTTYFDLVFATCYGILRDREEAAEATQETFMRALRTLESLPEDPRAWLKVVARNTGVTGAAVNPAASAYRRIVERVVSDRTHRGYGLRLENRASPATARRSETATTRYRQGEGIAYLVAAGAAGRRAEADDRLF